MIRRLEKENRIDDLLKSWQLKILSQEDERFIIPQVKKDPKVSVARITRDLKQVIKKKLVLILSAKSSIKMII